jgi:hypothetical protein
MSYIVQRGDRFYVVAYNGLDPLTGREWRRWHPVGRDRDDAEAVAQRLEPEHHGSSPPIGGATTLGTFLCQTWPPRKRRQVRATTAYRYAWLSSATSRPDRREEPGQQLARRGLGGRRR